MVMKKKSNQQQQQQAGSQAGTTTRERGWNYHEVRGEDRGVSTATATPTPTAPLLRSVRGVCRVT